MLTTSVLVPSFRRPRHLCSCLESLSRQTTPPSEVIVVWQADDEATMRAATQFRDGDWLRVIHNPVAGIVPAENLALRHATGDIVLLIDDDAVAPEYWIEQHLQHYLDSSVGAAGGPADNFHPDGARFPRRAVSPVGRLSWYGKLYGNMFDQDIFWRTRLPQEVDHLVGYNLSFRRELLDAFETDLRPYWQLFELEACLRIRSLGYRVLFDYANVVEHHPTNTAYAGGREGDLSLKVYNSAYNQAFILAKHSRRWQAAVRLAYLLLVGSVSNPGLAALPLAFARYGNLKLEIEILMKTWRAKVAGWRQGMKTRTSFRPVSILKTASSI